MASTERLNNSREQGGDEAHRRGSLARAVGYIAGLGLFAAPAAAYYGVSHAEVDDYLGANDTVFSVTTNGKSELDFGPLGAMTVPIHKGTFGLRAEIKGIEVAPDNPSNVSTLFSDKTLASYANLYGEPDQAIAGIQDLLVEDAIKKSLTAESIALAGIILIVGSGRVLIREDMKQKFTLTPLVTGGLLAVEAAVFASIVAAPPIDSVESQNVIRSLDGTFFEGSSTQNEPLNTILDRVIPSMRNLGKRQNSFLKEYQAASQESFNAQKSLVTSPRQNEDVIMTFSDLHCSYAMIPLLKDVADLYKPQVVVSAGDDTDFGSALEKGCIEKEKTITNPSIIVVAGGNHDSKTTEKQMTDVGMKLLKGKTITVKDTSILGDDDPEITPPLTSGYRVFEDEEESENDFGVRILEQALKDQPDIIALHQPDAIRPILDHIKNGDSSSRLTSLLLNGHLHERDGPNVIWNQDGTWTLQYQMGTAGGKGTATLTSFSTPFSKPLKTGETTIFFKDKDSRLITGYQILLFETDGTVTIMPRVDVGSADGQPIATTQGPVENKAIQ